MFSPSYGLCLDAFKESEHPRDKSGKFAGGVHEEVRSALRSRGFTKRTKLSEERERFEHPSGSTANLWHTAEAKAPSLELAHWGHPAYVSVRFGHQKKNTGPIWNANNNLPKNGEIYAGKAESAFEKSIGKLHPKVKK